MPNELNSLMVTATGKKSLDKTQAIVDCMVSAQEGGIKQILGVNATCELKNYEVLDGEATYEGSVTLEVLYQNNEGYVNAITSTFPFNAKLINSAIDVNTALALTPQVLDTNVEGFDADKVHIVCAVEVNPLAYINEEIKVASAQENMFAQSASVQINSLSAKSDALLKLETSLAIPSQIQKVLNTNADIQIKSVVPQTGYITVQGDAYVELLYITDGEEKIFKKQTQVLNFSEEIEVSGVNKESQIDLYSQVRKTEMQSVVSSTGEKAVVDVKIPVSLEVFAFSNQEIPTIIDAYSQTNDVLVTTVSFDQADITAPTVFEKKIDGVNELDEDETRIDKILAVSRASVFETNIIPDVNETTIEGVASLNIIYTREDDGEIAGKRIEIPFSISVDKVCPNAENVFVQMILTDVDVAVKKGHEIYVDGKIRGLIACIKNYSNAVASEILLGEELPNKNFALEVYFAKRGQTLWDVAKDMHEDIEVLKTQNPDLSEEFDGTEKIVCYRQSEINFA